MIRAVLNTRLREWNPDVVVDLSSAGLRGEFCAIPRHGVGDSISGQQEVSGRFELSTRAHRRRGAHRHRAPANRLRSSARRSSFRAEFSTGPYPAASNRLGPLWSAQHFVIQQLWKLHTAGSVAESKGVNPAGLHGPAKTGPPPSGASIVLWLSERNARRLRGAKEDIKPTVDLATGHSRVRNAAARQPEQGCAYRVSLAAGPARL